MQICVHTFADKRISLEVQPSDTFEQVKAMIQKLENIPPYQQRYSFASKWVMEDELPLSEYGIKDGSTVYLIKLIYAENRNTSKSLIK